VTSHEPTLPLHLFESYGEGAATTANGADAAAAVLAAAADGPAEAEAGADATYVTATVLDVRPSAITQGACGNARTVWQPTNARVKSDDRSELRAQSPTLTLTLTPDLDLASIVRTPADNDPSPEVQSMRRLTRHVGVWRPCICEVRAPVIGADGLPKQQERFACSLVTAGGQAVEGEAPLVVSSLLVCFPRTGSSMVTSMTVGPLRSSAGAGIVGEDGGGAAEATEAGAAEADGEAAVAAAAAAAAAAEAVVLDQAYIQAYLNKVASAMMRRRAAECLLRYHYYVRSMPANNLAVMPIPDEQLKSIVEKVR